MRYIKFKAETPYCGTDHEEYHVVSDDATKEDLDDMAEDIRRNIAEGYEYLVSGWNNENFEDMTPVRIDIAESHYTELLKTK